MEGREVYRHAVARMVEAMRAALDRAGLTADDLDLFVAHQANARIIEAAAAELGLPHEKVALNIDRVANTSSASIPLALAQAERDGLLAPGATVGLAAFGAGFVWGAGHRVVEGARVCHGLTGCAVVTGGTRGIGAAIADRLEADGWDVARLGRADADVADRDAVIAAFARVRDDRGPILTLINNAGIRADGLAISMDHDDWSSVVDTNLTGAFNCTKAALPDMLKARYGRIVNVSSVVAERANPGQANYVAAKAGLLGLHAHGGARDGPQGRDVQRDHPGLHRHRHDCGPQRRHRRRGPCRAGRAARRGRRRRQLPRLRRGGVRQWSHAVGRRRARSMNRSPTMSVPTNTEVLQVIREELDAIKVPGALEATEDQTWQDLDVDSLDLVELVKALEDRFGVAIADGRLKAIKTVGDAVALVQELATEGAPA